MIIVEDVALFIVYGLVHRNSGKAYIGMTDDVRRRVSQHRTQLRRQVHYNKELQEAFNEGCGFDVEELEYFDDYQMARAREWYWMWKWEVGVYNIYRGLPKDVSFDYILKMWEWAKKEEWEFDEKRLM